MKKWLDDDSSDKHGNEERERERERVDGKK